MVRVVVVILVVILVVIVIHDINVKPVESGLTKIDVGELYVCFA